MGSHGGGTPGGQCEILHGYGITPEAMGCETRASMETVVVAETQAANPDRLAVQFLGLVELAELDESLGEIAHRLGFDPLGSVDEK